MHKFGRNLALQSINRSLNEEAVLYVGMKIKKRADELKLKSVIAEQDSSS